MKEIVSFKEVIERELKKIQLPSEPKNLYNPIHYILNLDAKRIRSIALLITHQLYNEDYTKAISAALAIEMFHNFTLIHDDIMDNASMRRGSLTVHEKWDKNIAILSGDTLLVQSYRMLFNLDSKIKEVVLKKFSETAVIVCEGQQMDMDYEKESSLQIKDYLLMIEKKTSVLFASSFEIGAIIGEATLEDQKLFYNFGLNLGIAFQLQDDLLDLYGDPSKFGKKIGGDVLTNKKTFLFLKALELSNEDQHKALMNFYSSTNFDDKKKIEAVKNIFDDLKIYKITKDLISEYNSLAIDCSKQITIENKDSLNYFINLLNKREV
mgnify:FL=1